MNQEIKSIVKKTAKIAGVTCFALGGAALIASGAALKALTEGAKYLNDSVQKILADAPEAQTVVDAVPAEETGAEESTQTDAVEESAAGEAV